MRDIFGVLQNRWCYIECTISGKYKKSWDNFREIQKVWTISGKYKSLDNFRKIQKSWDNFREIQTFFWIHFSMFRRQIDVKNCSDLRALSNNLPLFKSCNFVKVWIPRIGKVLR